MKFAFFNLMPYRFLPKDFEKNYPSIWVDVALHQKSVPGVTFDST